MVASSAVRALALAVYVLAAIMPAHGQQRQSSPPLPEISAASNLSVEVADEEAWARAQARLMRAFDGHMGRQTRGIEAERLRATLRAIFALLRHEAYRPPPPEFLVRNAIDELERFSRRKVSLGGRDRLISLLEIAAAGLVDNVDRYSQFIPVSSSASRRARLFGDSFDIGVQLEQAGDDVRFRRVVEGRRAEMAGIRQGDVLIGIDGISMEGSDAEDIALLLNALSSKMPTLSVRREGQADLLHYTLRPDESQLPSSESRRLGQIVYIKLRRFDRDAREMVEREIIFSGGVNRPGSAGVILDLRGNGGGVLRQGALVANAFLDGGTIVSVESRDPLDSVILSAREGDLANGLPVVVLIDRYSASAAEIVAAALQDHGRATIIGARSAGKGTIQTRHDLGSTGAVYLTTGRFFRPSGAWVQESAVAPDLTLGGPGDGTLSISPHSCASHPGIDDPWVACAVGVLRAGGVRPFLGTPPTR